MQESSWWTWYRADGSRYEAVPGLWMRVAARPRWQDARDEFGPVVDYDQQLPPSLFAEHAAREQRPKGEIATAVARKANNAGWQDLHRQLKAMAQLWQPQAHNPEVHYLVPFNPLQHGDAVALRFALEKAAVDGELAPRLDGFQLRVVPQSLRGFLAMTCAADLAAQQRYRRCANCGEWFPVDRADRRTCSNACRQAHHRSAGAAVA